MSWSRMLACEKRSAPAASHDEEAPRFPPQGLVMLPQTLARIRGTRGDGSERSSRMIETPPRSSFENFPPPQFVVSLKRTVLVELACAYPLFDSSYPSRHRPGIDAPAGAQMSTSLS